jgi:hypothetical protein
MNGSSKKPLRQIKAVLSIEKSARFMPKRDFLG